MCSRRGRDFKGFGGDQAQDAAKGRAGTLGWLNVGHSQPSYKKHIPDPISLLSIFALDMLGTLAGLACERFNSTLLL